MNTVYVCTNTNKKYETKSLSSLYTFISREHVYGYCCAPHMPPIRIRFSATRNQPSLVARARLRFYRALGSPRFSTPAARRLLGLLLSHVLDVAITALYAADKIMPSVVLLRRWALSTQPPPYREPCVNSSNPRTGGHFSLKKKKITLNKLLHMVDTFPPTRPPVNNSSLSTNSFAQGTHTDIIRLGVSLSIAQEGSA